MGMTLSSDSSLPAASQNDGDSKCSGYEKEQLRLQATILRHISDGVIATDMHGYITYWNEGASAIFGYTAGEMLGHTPVLLYPEKDIVRAVQHLKDVLAGFDYLGEWEGRCKDGTAVWVDVQTTLMRDMQGQPVGLIGIVKDITERKKLAEEAARTKDHLISMASHELKTPLTVLSAYTQLLKEQFEAADRHDVVLTLSKMDTQIANLNKLVVDLLDISRMQAGQLEMAWEMVDVDQLVQEVVANLQPTTTHHLLIEGAAGQPVPGDRGRLEQVLIILLTNAIKYSPQADRVVVRIAPGDEKLTVSVQDFGIGIAQSHHARIFDRFYRVLNEKDQTFPGLGIGLYIAREIIERHGGQMWVESVEGSGSTFFFSLPISGIK
jgi:PAS domain S-box-containing protein